MQKAKKIFSVLLAVIMLATTFTCFASAGAPAPTGSYMVSIAYEVCHADGTVATTVTRGETVTVNVYANSATTNDALQALVNSIYFDESVYTYVEGSIEYIGIADWVDAEHSTQTLYNSSNATVTVNKNSIAAWTDDEKAAHPGWTSFVYCVIAKLYSGSDYYVQENANTPMYSIKLLVKDDAAVNGDASVGCPASVYFIKRGQAYNFVRTTATGAITNASKATDSSANEFTTTVGSAAKEYETSIVSFWKDQIKMENDEYTSFSIRHLAQIEASVWESTFGTDEDKDSEGKKNITDIGFIFQKGDGFDKDAAANWLEAGATDDSFTKAGVNFVSTGMKDGYYVFSCTITGVDDPDAALSSLGYVVWVDDANTPHYSYFENVETETFRDLYDRYVAAH